MKDPFISGNFRKASASNQFSRSRFWLYFMAATYVLAGMNHFRSPETYLRIMPPWLPFPTFLVAISGIAELVLGILLLSKKARRLAAWGIILLLIAVFPANVQMAIDWHRTQNPYGWIAWLRLPLQGILIRWAWRYTKTREKL